MGGTGVIDHFLEVFTRYIDSGFGLLGGEVAFIATTLIVIDMTVAALFWSWGADEDILPFYITNTPLRPVIQAAGDMGFEIPIWDIADKFGDRTDLLVVNMEQARDLARCLGGNRMALMRGHGFVSIGFTLYDLVRMSVYMLRNARVLTAAMRMGEVRALSAGEVEARLALDPNSPSMRRGWEYWAREAGCDEFLAD